MYIVPGLVLLAAIFAAQQGSPSSNYGAIEPGASTGYGAARIKLLEWAIPTFGFDNVKSISGNLKSNGQEIFGVQISYHSTPGGFRKTQLQTERIATENGLSLRQYIVRPTDKKTILVLFGPDPVGAFHELVNVSGYGSTYGQDADADPTRAFMNTPEYREWSANLKANATEPTAVDKATGVLAIVIETFKQQVTDYIPQVHSFDVRGGQDEDGERYAAVTMSTTDPYGVIEQVASYALQAAGAQGVSVTTEPSDDEEKIVLIFSQGAVPEHS